jgi:hypothetical protein
MFEIIYMPLTYLSFDASLFQFKTGEAGAARKQKLPDSLLIA